jgi:heterodisulfide reductase subunit B
MDKEDLDLIVKKLDRLLKREKNPRGIQCHECGCYGHIWAKCANLQGNAFNVTLHNESDCDKIDETYGEDLNFLAFACSYGCPHKSSNDYFENSESEEKYEIQSIYNKLFVKYSELRDLNK